MTESPPTARARIAPAGLMFLAITSVGWGFNWPVTKYLLGEVPPLTLRGVTGVIGASLLAGLALIRRDSLSVGEGQWPRLVLAAMLNVTCWMVLMAYSLFFLPASEATLIAYTMPVWASLLAWPVLGERPTVLRTLALAMAFAGLASIMGGNGLVASMAKLPGILLALGGAIGFAFGTVLAKKLPLQLPPMTAAAWQIGIGCLPIAIIGLLFEATYLEKISVTVTLQDDVITAVSVSGNPQKRESEEYQSKFIGGISSEVVGKSIDEISVSRVAGSSWPGR